MQTTETHAADPAIKTCLELTGDPIDAMRLASDLYAISAYRAEKVNASASHRVKPPKPISKYLRRFTASLKSNLTAIASMLDPDDLRRLTKVGPAIIERLNRADVEVDERLFRMALETPVEAAVWLHDHLDEIEERFAS